jgi:hypothetical protein
MTIANQDDPKLENIWLVGCHYTDIGFVRDVLEEDRADLPPNGGPKKSREVTFEATFESYASRRGKILVRLRIKITPAVQPTCVIDFDCIAALGPTGSSDPQRMRRAEQIAAPCLLTFAREKLGGLTIMTPYPTFFLEELDIDALLDRSTKSSPRGERPHLRSGTRGRKGAAKSRASSRRTPKER